MNTSRPAEARAPRDEPHDRAATGTKKPNTQIRSPAAKPRMMSNRADAFDPRARLFAFPPSRVPG